MQAPLHAVRDRRRRGGEASPRGGTRCPVAVRWWRARSPRPVLTDSPRRGMAGP